MKTNTVKTARLESAMTAANIRPFRCESSYPENDAPRNLQGRTHYCDPDTLRYFKARILNGGHTKDGLLYWFVESVQSRPDHGGYNRRAVVFDVFGDIVNERAGTDGGDWFKDTSKAEKSAFEFLKTFDAPRHTAAKLKERAKREILEAKRTLAALAGRVMP